MRYAFTGPSHLDGKGLVAARCAVAAITDATEFTTGGADGWDVAVAFAAVQFYPYARHRIVCPAAAYARDAVDRILLYADIVDIDLEVVRLEPRATETPAEAYRYRNERLVDHADRLIGGVRSPRYYRSGEWMTLNIARRRGVPYELVVVGSDATVPLRTPTDL